MDYKEYKVGNNSMLRGLESNILGLTLNKQIGYGKLLKD